MNPEIAEELQDEIFRKMPDRKKLKIASQLFLLGKKLNSLKKQNGINSGGAPLKNRKNTRRA